MIKINTMHIQDNMPLKVAGEEDPAILEFTKNDPEPDGKIVYDCFASMVGGKDVLLSGVASIKVKAVCGRCGDKCSYELKVKEVCHLYEGVKGQIIDVTDDIREDLLLEIPYVIYCSDDCKGLCAGCGANLNREKCKCSKKKEKKQADASPWGALDKLKFEPEKAKKKNG